MKHWQPLLGPETLPGVEYSKRDEVRTVIRTLVGSAFHPVGTCMMGPGTDPSAVVDPRLAIHGLDDVFVVDASVMPTIPRANTHLPTVVIAERFVDLLLGAQPVELSGA